MSFDPIPAQSLPKGKTLALEGLVPDGHTHVSVELDRAGFPDTPAEVVEVLVELDQGRGWEFFGGLKTTGGAVFDPALGATAKTTWATWELPAVDSRSLRVTVTALVDGLTTDLVCKTFLGPTVPHVPQDHNSVVFDAASGNHAGTTSSLTWSHTCTGSNRGLVVFSLPWAATVTGVTYNSVSLTASGALSASSSDGHTARGWHLAAPASGANTVAVNLSAAGTIAAVAISATSVDQTTPVGGYATATGTTAAVSVALSGGASGALAAGATSYWISGGSGTANGGWDERIDTTGATSRYSATHTMSGSTDTYDVTLSAAGSHADVALFFNEAAAAASPAIPSLPERAPSRRVQKEFEFPVRNLLTATLAVATMPFEVGLDPAPLRREGISVEIPQSSTLQLAATPVAGPALFDSVFRRRGLVPWDIPEPPFPQPAATPGIEPPLPDQVFRRRSLTSGDLPQNPLGLAQTPVASPFVPGLESFIFRRRGIVPDLPAQGHLEENFPPSRGGDFLVSPGRSGIISWEIPGSLLGLTAVPAASPLVLSPDPQVFRRKPGPLGDAWSSPVTLLGIVPPPTPFIPPDLVGGQFFRITLPQIQFPPIQVLSAEPPVVVPPVVVVYDPGEPPRKKRKPGRRELEKSIDETLEALLRGEDPPELLPPPAVEILRENLPALSPSLSLPKPIRAELALAIREWELEIQDEEDLLRLL